MEMLEDSNEFELESQEPFCRSFSKSTINEDSKVNFKEENIHDAAYKSIFDELLDDSILELCFEVHRVAKLGFTHHHNMNNLAYQGKDVGLHSETTKNIVCPACKQSKGTKNYTKHLASCMGSYIRSSSRKATQKIKNCIEYDSNSEDNSDSESLQAGTKKKSKKQNKGARRKPKLLGNSLSKPSSDSNPNYMDMTHDERRAFFKQRCGVISKRTKKLCNNSLNCSVHNDDHRRSVRHDLLSTDEFADNGHIDVDTVDDEFSNKPSYLASGNISSIFDYSGRS